MSVGTEQRLATPVPGVEQPELPLPPKKGLHTGVRLNVRGRTIRLRGIQRAPTGMMALVAVLGPGLIAATAGDDAGGIASYSQMGAKYGYDLLWALVLITITLAIVQEMAARLGAATGRGLLDLVREHFGIGWTLFAVVVVLISNTAVIVTEFAGIGAAAEMFGISRYIAVPVCAAAIWYSLVGGNYASVEKVFLLMALAFLAYPATVILGQPDWGAVAHGFIPNIKQHDPEYLSLLVVMIGTTVTPYMQLFQQSSVVEKGIARSQYGPERADAYLGATFSNVIAACILIAAAATLHASGMTEIQGAGDAARALEPVAGKAAQALFAVGLIGASMLAAGVLPLATAYAVSEAFGFRKGVNLDFRRAPFFVGLFSAVILIGAVVALVPGIPLISLLLWIQTLNGLLLPVVLAFILLLINNKRLVGSLRNGWVTNLLGWGSLVMVALAAGGLIVNEVLGVFGLSFLR